MLEKYGQRKVIIPLAILFLVNLALFSLPGVPGSRSVILAKAEEGVNIPDMMGIYSPEDVYHFLEAIGPEGRSAFQTMHFSTDLTFPLVYGCLLFALLCRNVRNLKANLHWLAHLGWLPMLFDLAENFTLVAITARFPDFLPGLTQLAQVFTIVKFGGIFLCTVMIIGLAITKGAETEKQTL